MARLTADERAAEAQIAKLHEQHPDVVDAVYAIMEIAHPLAGPERILAEIEAALA